MPARKQSFRTARPLVPAAAQRLDSIAQALVAWTPPRQLPWRSRQTSPFETLVAETLLVRTRAEAVGMVVDALWKRYPTPPDLALASDADVAQIIAPLGLVKRARMLREAAIQIISAGGEVPHDRRALGRLKGVGDYVADAVRVFAFGERVIPVDAVVGRVLRRVFGYPSLGPAYADRALWSVVQPLAIHGDARHLVAALLDVGAILCRPLRPQCGQCPLRANCDYNVKGTRADSPVSRRVAA